MDSSQGTHVSPNVSATYNTSVVSLRGCDALPTDGCYHLTALLYSSAYRAISVGGDTINRLLYPKKKGKALRKNWLLRYCTEIQGSGQSVDRTWVRHVCHHSYIITNALQYSSPIKEICTAAVFLTRFWKPSIYATANFIYTTSCCMPSVTNWLFD